MAKRPTRIAMSFALMGDSGDIGIAKDIFGALDRHGLAPQFVNAMDSDDPTPVTAPEDFTSRWLIEGATRSLETNAPTTLSFGPDWTRKNAPQGWGSVSHRLVNVKGRIKLGRINLDHVFSPRVDWKAAFVDLCQVLDPLVATITPFRRETQSTLGFVDAFPLPAEPKRERITKPVQVNDTPWGTLRDVPWGMWLGPLWEQDRRDALAAHMIQSGDLLHLSDAVPSDPDILTTERDRVRAALPDLFDPNPKFLGLP